MSVRAGEGTDALGMMGSLEQGRVLKGRVQKSRWEVEGRCGEWMKGRGRGERVMSGGVDARSRSSTGRQRT